ncbi:MAG: endolytic transglycosylase MltG [Patescibacteria group bacterium]
MLSKLNKIIIFSIILAIILAGSFFYFHYQAYYSYGSYRNVKMFKIEKGDGNGTVSQKLKEEGLISGKAYFYYYIKTHSLINKILPGDYELSGKMTIPEIASTITKEQNKFARITFPEGWDSKKMAERLSANGLPGEEFLSIVQNPPKELTDKYSFFSMLSKNSSLEGYLFPDTYFFSKNYKAEDIIGKMLSDFDTRLTPDIREEIKKQGKTLEQIIIMASIIEREVKSNEDRKIVSGIFWYRIKNGQPLQSCATISYMLGVNKKQYSFEDTRIKSPFNTYLNKGLPPGPISNPGIESIKASIHPAFADYNYFLSDPETGKTIFSRTIDEHNFNKAKFGL